MEKMPIDLKKALAASPKATLLWKELTPIARRDFITWIEQAKQETTRERRVGVAIDKLLSGQRRPCCYAVVPMSLYKALGKNAKAKAIWKTLTPDERRDLVARVESAKSTEGREKNVAKAITLLAAGKRRY